jgi:uncharacterized membrane protein YhhN
MQRALRLGFFGFAVLFVALIPIYPYPGGWVIKTIPALCLSLLALADIPGLTGKLLSLGLLFSAAGDAALGFNDLYGGVYFIIGLGLFLVAQAIYAMTFARGIQVQRSRIPLAFLMIAYSCALAIILRPNLGEMLLPVFIYIVVITLMAIVAALRTMEGSSLVVGAIAFMLSDSLIAIHKFVTPIPAERFFTIITYFFAQYMITTAFMQQTQRG